MKLTIEGNPEEIKNTLKTITGSGKCVDELSKEISEMQRKAIEKLSQIRSIYQSFLDYYHQ